MQAATSSSLTYIIFKGVGGWGLQTQTRDFQTLSVLTISVALVKIVNVTFRERYQKPRWWKPIPDSHKLTEADITRFVESMKSAVFTSMFSKYGSADSSIALKHLSTMRPELIVPPLLEK